MNILRSPPNIVGGVLNYTIIPNTLPEKMSPNVLLLLVYDTFLGMYVSPPFLVISLVARRICVCVRDLDQARRRKWIRTRAPRPLALDNPFRPLSLAWEVNATPQGRFEVRVCIKAFFFSPSWLEEGIITFTQVCFCCCRWWW